MDIKKWRTSSHLVNVFLLASRLSFDFWVLVDNEFVTYFRCNGQLSPFSHFNGIGSSWEGKIARVESSEDTTVIMSAGSVFYVITRRQDVANAGIMIKVPGERRPVERSDAHCLRWEGIIAGGS